MRASAVASDAMEAEGSAGAWVPPPRTGKRPLDLVHLARQTFGDKQLESELLRLFMRQAEQIAQALDVAATERAPGQDDVALLHMLSGSARAIGATAVAGLAGVGETRLRNGAALSGSDRLELRHAIRTATAYIAELLDQG